MWNRRIKTREMKSLPKALEAEEATGVGTEEEDTITKWLKWRIRI
jgi:hypothetical protein